MKTVNVAIESRDVLIIDKTMKGLSLKDTWSFQYHQNRRKNLIFKHALKRSVGFAQDVKINHSNFSVNLWRKTDESYFEQKIRTTYFLGIWDGQTTPYSCNVGVSEDFLS